MTEPPTTGGGWTPTPAAPKRFYAQAEAGEVAPGRWTVLLDGKPIRTPAKAAFEAPQRVALAAAAEWAAQGERLAPETMPVTRAVNSAIDRIAPQRAGVIEEIAGYGGSDLLCYRAESPAALVARQAAAWDPPLDWAAEALSAQLRLCVGVVHQAQDPASLAALQAAVAAESDIGLAALSELTSLSGSLILALATARGVLTAEAAWAASRIDEEWQIEQWGRDAEAEATALRRRDAFLAAARLAQLLSSDTR